MDVSRIESGKIELNKSERSIRKIIKNCIEDLQFLSISRNISILLEYSDDVIIKLDKIRIEQVLTNIIINAIKNTPSFGEILVSVMQEADFLTISIADTGVGFTEEEQLKVFGKFGKIERYGQGMDVDTEGTGLGLFISKEIVELHDGTIELISEGRNKGSTFKIILPL